MTRRRRKVRWPFCCSRCGAWIPGGAKFSDDGTWWFCLQCALEHSPAAEPARQGSRP